MIVFKLLNEYRLYKMFMYDSCALDYTLLRFIYLTRQKLI